MVIRNIVEMQRRNGMNLKVKSRLDLIIGREDLLGRIEV